MNNFKDQTALILGYGISGEAVARYLEKRGARLICMDKRADHINSFSPACVFLPDTADVPWDSIDFVVKSPGISPEHPVLQKAAQNKIRVTSEIELALLHLKNSHKTLFGVTGSNGKTTTVSLAAHLFSESGYLAKAVGNIGIPLLSQVEDPSDIFIVELSSFQIELIEPAPYFDVGIVLNITENHLDRYSSFEAYAQAKMHLAHLLKPNAPLFIQDAAKEKFSYLAPFACFHPFPEFQENVETILSLSYREVGSLFGQHDIENLRAASALCKQKAMRESDILKSFLTFKKPAHRVEKVGSIAGVSFINDSKATSVDAVLKAIETVPGKLILIAGGVDKGGSFQEWIPICKGKVKCVLAIGQAAARIQTELQDHIPVERISDLGQAVERALTLASKGESVLLSPGCSSYDQFRDYQERGEFFKQKVRELSRVE